MERRDNTKLRMDIVLLEGLIEAENAVLRIKRRELAEATAARESEVEVSENELMELRSRLGTALAEFKEAATESEWDYFQRKYEASAHDVPSMNGGPE